MNLTPKQAQLAAFIREFVRARGYAPSLDEMAKRFGVSRITIHERLGGLEKRGVLRRAKYQARAIELLERVTSHTVPLLGYIAAGEPIEAVENKEDVDVGEMLDSGKEQYVLKVRGTSMIDEQIRDGDYVIVEKRDRARNGETVVALVNGSEATLKKFYREKDGRIRLQPANPDMPPIFPRDVKIQGVVIGVVRKY